jgi:iron complex outermembrane receptor protein
VCRGRVVDAATQRPVSWANLVLTSSDSAFQQVRVSLGDGSFQFLEVPAGSYHLVAHHVAYVKERCQAVVSGGDTLWVLMKLTGAVFAVDSVAVTAHAPDEESFTGQRPVALGGESLRRHLDDTVASALAAQPGIAERSMGPAPARPVLRGMDSYRVLVLEDGGGVGDVSATSPDHAVTIEPLHATRIDVVRGPAALMYGPAASAGVVNVTHDYVPRERLDRWAGSAAMNAARVNQGRAVQASLDGPAGPLMLNVDGSARGGDDVRTPEGTLGNTGIETYSAAAGASVVGDHGYAGVAGNLYRSDYGIPGGFMGGHPDGVDVHIEREHVEGRWERHLRAGGAEHGEAHLGYSRFYQEERESNDACGVAYGVVTYEANARVRFNLAGAGRATGGVFGEYRDFAQTCFTFLPRTDEYTAAGYVYDECALGDTHLRASLRYDSRIVRPSERDENAAGTIRDREFDGLSWALGAETALGGGWNVGATVMRSFRAPSLEELFAEGPHLAAYSYEVGNADLEAERGLSGEVFGGWKGERGHVSAAAFYNAFEGYIYATDTGELEIGPGAEGFLPIYRYVGRDAHFEGAELDVAWKASRRWLLEGAVGAVRGTLSDTDSPLPRIPPVAGQVDVSCLIGAWRLRAGSRAAAEQTRVGEFEEPTDGYVLLDLGVEWTRVAGSHFHSLTLRADNVTNETYRNHLSRTKAIMPEPGWNLSVLYRVSFL